jgi:hypothetical protein
MVLFACTKQETLNAVGWTWGNRYNQVSMPRDLSAPTAVALDVRPVNRTFDDGLHSFLIKVRCIKGPDTPKYKEYAFYVCGAKGPIFEVSNHTQLPTNTHLPGLNWTSDQPVPGAPTYTIHDKQKRLISVPSVIAAIERQKTYALDRTATGIRKYWYWVKTNLSLIVIKHQATKA